MKILHVISSGGMYGAEAVILNLSRTLNRRGHTSLLGIFSNSANPNLQLYERAMEEGIESHLIPCCGQIDRTVPANIRTLAAITGADLIHAHGYKADVYVYLGMQGATTPVVSTCHNWLDDTRMVRLYGMMDRLVLRRFQGVIAVSEGVKGRLIGSGIPPPNVHLIRNGVDMRPFAEAGAALSGRRPTRDVVLVGWVGRLSHEKGPDLLLSAVAKVRLEFPNSRFILVGEGPDRLELERSISRLGIGGIVELQGQRTDMPSVYASCDFMVSTSRSEGLPMTILEGMASGLPWVATSVGDVPTLVRDGQTGILIPPENVEMLAHGLARMIQNSEERTRMGLAARHLIEAEFSAERMAEDYLRVYRVATAKEANLASSIDGAARGGKH